jgi:hypothetical protein
MIGIPVVTRQNPVQGNTDFFYFQTEVASQCGNTNLLYAAGELYKAQRS